MKFNNRDFPKIPQYNKTEGGNGSFTKGSIDRLSGMWMTLTALVLGITYIFNALVNLGSTNKQNNNYRK